MGGNTGKHIDDESAASSATGAASPGVPESNADKANRKHTLQVDFREVGKHVLFALLVGVAAGLASVLLCICVNFAYTVFQKFPLLIWALPVMGILQLLLYRAFKLPGDLTTHRVVINIRDDKPISYLLAPGILITTCMSMLCGGSVGKEAGALQIGASLGSLISRPFKMRSVYKKNADEPMDGYVAAAGMAACFSALFFAPLGAAMFVFELAKYKRSVIKHAATILLACFVAYFVSSAIGIGDIIDKIELPPFDWHVVGQLAVVGLACALAGTIFDNAIQWIHDITWRITHNLYVWVVVGGLLFAALVTFFGWGSFTGSGGDILGYALKGTFEPWGFAVKLLLTCICLAFWLKGGEIMPSFCIGGLLGAACTFLTGGSPELGAAVGILSFFAAFSRCPFAAFLMGCEIFGWAAAPYMAIGVFVATISGSPVGYYGEGVDRVIRTRWHSLSGRVRKQRFAESDKEYVGALRNVEQVGEAVKETIDDPSTKSSQPG